MGRKDPGLDGQWENRLNETEPKRHRTLMLVSTQSILRSYHETAHSRWFVCCRGFHQASVTVLFRTQRLAKKNHAARNVVVSGSLLGGGRAVKSPLIVFTDHPPPTVRENDPGAKPTAHLKTLKF